MDLLTKAREIFKKDLFATEATGITIEAVEENYAKCQLIVEEKHRNAVGGVMGGVLFTLADFTFAVAANIGGDMTVSVTSHITYLNPVKGKVLTAETQCEKAGRRTCSLMIYITDEYDTPVANVSITGMRVGKMQ